MGSKHMSQIHPAKLNREELNNIEELRKLRLSIARNQLRAIDETVSALIGSGKIEFAGDPALIRNEVRLELERKIILLSQSVKSNPSSAELSFYRNLIGF